MLISLWLWQNGIWVECFADYSTPQCYYAQHRSALNKEIHRTMTTEQSAAQSVALIERLERLPVQVDHLVTGLTPARLTTHFLPQEWTVAQNVHHLADSHMNAYLRCKLILTEENPTLKPYDQDAWAALPDASEALLSTSLSLLQGLHTRWVHFFRTLGDNDWARTGYHPVNGLSLIHI